MTAPNISYVKDFPKEIALKNPTTYNNQLLDVKGCLIKGKYMIVCTGEKQKTWKIIDLDNNKIVAGIFNPSLTL